MTKRSTTEEFVEKSTKLHGDKYDYSLVEYTTNTAKVKIVCRKHNEFFLQAPANHLKGSGCPICRYETTALKATKSLEDFISSARLVHGDRYDYSRSEYKSTHTLLTIICKKHNKPFEQKPTNHLSGKGCQLCAAEKVRSTVLAQVLTTEQFIDKAKAVHGDLYDYTHTVYDRSAKKASIWCNRHSGFFKQAPNPHLRGIGCPICATHGYRGSRPGWLYVLFNGTLTKVGITNNEVKIRVDSINRKSKKNFKIVGKFYFENGTHADLLETTLLRELKRAYLRPNEKFDGSTECFLQLDPNELVKDITARLPQDHKEHNDYRPNLQHREASPPSC